MVQLEVHKITLPIPPENQESLTTPKPVAYYCFPEGVLAHPA